MKPLSYINELEAAVSYSSVFSLPCLVWCSVWNLLVEPLWDKGSIPWLQSAPRLIFLTPSRSCSYADLLAIHSWKCRFDKDLAFYTWYRRKNPAPFFHVPVFISSCLFFGPNPSPFIVVGQSEPGSALKHWQVHGFKHAPPAWWNCLPHKSDNQSLKPTPKQAPNSLNGDIFKYRDSCLKDRTPPILKEAIQIERVPPS